MIVTGNYDYVTTRGSGPTELVWRLRWMCVTQRRDYFMSNLMYGSFSIFGTVLRFLCPRGSNHVLNILPIYMNE